MSADEKRGSGTELSVGRSVLVVGAGEVGRWIADVFEAPDTAFADIDGGVAREAAERANGRVFESTDDPDEPFDLVVIAVPISGVVEAIETHGSQARRGIVDVTGVMGPPLDAMAAHVPDLDRVSLHPLFAPERAPGRVAMAGGRDTGSSGSGERGERGSEAHVETDLAAAIETALRAAGNDPFVTSATEHDEAMATVQARTHAAVVAFSLAAEPVREEFHTPISAALADLATQVTGGTPRTYAEIQSTFSGAESVARAAERIATASPEAFEALYNEAGDRLRKPNGERS